ncbi:hypothetical protein [Cellulomonas sp. KRMCY2]|uniref:hypothetical protein n=1 Tax=Cellulomonas sp. KRMCY2 TaxID=1304865 RepID=UPI00045EC13C|nr:hypothetical protein [Cellulomonas sp. KRMCY2]
MAVPHTHPHAHLAAPPAGAAHRALRAAWISVGFFVVSFVAAMVLGDWLITVQGYASGSDVRVGVALRAGIPALLVLIAPAAPAVWFGLRARRLGAENGVVPALVGGVLGAVAVIQNLGSLALTHWFG